MQKISRQVPNNYPQGKLISTLDERSLTERTSCPRRVKYVLFPVSLNAEAVLDRTQTATVKESSLRVTARYIVSRSNGSRPASVINRTRSARRIPCGVVAPASW